MAWFPQELSLDLAARLGLDAVAQLSCPATMTAWAMGIATSKMGFYGYLTGFYGYLMGFYGGLMGFYGDLMGFYGYLMGFCGDLMVI